MLKCLNHLNQWFWTEFIVWRERELSIFFNLNFFSLNKVVKKTFRFYKLLFIHPKCKHLKSTQLFLFFISFGRKIVDNDIIIYRINNNLRNQRMKLFYTVFCYHSADNTIFPFFYYYYLHWLTFVWINIYLNRRLRDAGFISSSITHALVILMM